MTSSHHSVLVVSDSTVGLVRGGGGGRGASRSNNEGTILLKNNASDVQMTLQDDDNVHFVAYVTVNDVLHLKHLHVLMTTSGNDRDAVAELLNKVAGQLAESDPSEDESHNESGRASPSTFDPGAGAGAAAAAASDDGDAENDIFAVRYLGRAPVSSKTWWDKNSAVLGDISKADIERKTMNDLFNAATAAICSKAPPGTARADGTKHYPTGILLRNREDTHSPPSVTGVTGCVSAVPPFNRSLALSLSLSLGISLRSAEKQPASCMLSKLCAVVAHSVSE